MFHDFYNIYKTGFTYYDVFFNITFIVLILIISLIIYWDLVNKNSLANSSCNNIKEIIEQNANSVEPYIYNIIIIKTDTIYDINYKNYAIKITYNFKKQKTDIDIKDIETFKSYDKTNGNIFDFLTYYDLSTGQKKEINNIYRNDSNENKLKEYEFICVDKNYKRIKTKAAKLLCTFTKEYLYNDLYSKAIIDNINIANKKKYKIVL